jgi:hypothetical protein
MNTVNLPAPVVLEGRLRASVYNMLPCVIKLLD